MRKTAQNGFSLIQLLLIVVMISVVSTAFWNLQVSRTEASYDGYRGGTAESSVNMALEDLKYHIGMAGYDLEKGKKPLKIVKGKKSDKLVIWHNDVCFEFYVDNDNNLIKKIEKSEKIIAENVNALKTTKMDNNKVSVTLSTVSMKDNDEDKIETLSKSYSTVVEMRNLL